MDNQNLRCDTLWTQLGPSYLPCRTSQVWALFSGKKKTKKQKQKVRCIEQYLSHVKPQKTTSFWTKNGGLVFPAQAWTRQSQLVWSASWCQSLRICDNKIVLRMIDHKGKCRMIDHSVYFHHCQGDLVHNSKMFYFLFCKRVFNSRMIYRFFENLTIPDISTYILSGKPT